MQMLGKLCRRMRIRNYKVVIKHAAAISLVQLRMVLAGCPTNIPAQALQVLDMVLSDVVFNKRSDMEYSMVGTLGVEAWKGIYQSIRLMQNGLSVLVGRPFGQLFHLCQLKHT